MCTASWLIGPDGFELFFNRDERRTRARSLPPRLLTAPDGTRFLAPIDAESGGTWIAVNEHGLAVCLLNRYPEVLAPATPRSRGHLVTHLAGTGALAAAADLGAAAGSELESLGLHDYRPFTLFILANRSASRSRSPVAFDWDGASLSRDDSLGRREPLTSSSGDPGGVANRHAVWDQLRASGVEGLELHTEFHRSHLPARSGISVCMHRPEAETESHCRVRVEPAAVALAWTPGSPCTAGVAHEIRLQRRPFSAGAATTPT